MNVLAILIPVTLILGGIGFPVVFELSKKARQPERWSLQTKITLSTTAILLAE